VQGEKWDEWQRAGVSPPRLGSPGHSQPRGGTNRHLYPYLLSSGTMNAHVRGVGSSNQRADCVHTTLIVPTRRTLARISSPGGGHNDREPGGVAGDAACPEAEEPVVAVMHAWPQAAAPAPAAATQAKAVEVRSEPLSVGSTSSRHHCEEHYGAEIQHQEGALVTLRQMRARADPARPTYAFGGGCLAFTDDLRRVTWPHKFRPGIIFKYGGTTDTREFL
jgi:hypothetical protein